MKKNEKEVEHKRQNDKRDIQREVPIFTLFKRKSSYLIIHISLADVSTSSQVRIVSGAGAKLLQHLNSIFSLPLRE